MIERVFLALTISVSGFTYQILIFLLVVFEVWRLRGSAVDTEAGSKDDDDDPDSRTYDMTMPDVRVIRTESAASRWTCRLLD